MNAKTKTAEKNQVTVINEETTVIRGIVPRSVGHIDRL